MLDETIAQKETNDQIGAGLKDVQHIMIISVYEFGNDFVNYADKIGKESYKVKRLLIQ